MLDLRGTRSAACSVRAVWARSIVPTTSDWTEKSPSSCYPHIFTSDPDRLARFEREARVLASLNHPNIAAIYGIEDTSTEPATARVRSSSSSSRGPRSPTGSLAGRSRSPRPLIGHSDRARPRGRARKRDRASRSQAGEHQNHAAGHCQSPRFRARDPGQGRRRPRRLSSRPWLVSARNRARSWGRSPT